MTKDELQLLVNQANAEYGWGASYFDIEKFANLVAAKALAQPLQRKPLTDEEIDAVTDSQWAKGVNKPIYAAHRAYARAIEAAHGIKENT